MVVIGRRYGQLANRLRLFTHFLANAWEQGYAFLNPSFYEYAALFPATAGAQWRRWPTETQAPAVAERAPEAEDLSPAAAPPAWWAALTYQALYLPASACARLRVNLPGFRVLNIRRTRDARNEPVDLAGAEFQELRRRAGLLVVQGWRFRDYPAVERQAERLRRFFAPQPQTRAAVQQALARLRGEGDVVCGIHIRQGDYAKWRGGVHYYETAAYAAAMRRITELFPGRRTAFLVCSNVPQDPAVFAGLTWRPGPGRAIEDLYALAGCDYLLGPPSTFTEWAAFYGGAKLCSWERTEQELSLEGFQTRRH